MEKTVMARPVRLLWVARILLLASAVCILILSYCFYQPRNYPLGMHVSPQAGQVLLYGGLVMVIAGFAWIWPGAGGVLAILYGCLCGLIFWGVGQTTAVPQTLIPAPAYYALYSIFIVGGVLNLIIGLRQKSAPSDTALDKRLRWIARIMAFASIVIFIIAYIFIYPPLVFLAVFALVIAGIAWRWPVPGGILMLLISLPDFYPLYRVGWDFGWKWPIYILLPVFIAGGILHLVVAWRARRQRTV